jgi:hypothetical protein
MEQAKMIGIVSPAADLIERETRQSLRIRGPGESHPASLLRRIQAPGSPRGG